MLLFFLNDLNVLKKASRGLLEELLYRLVQLSEILS